MAELGSSRSEESRCVHVGYLFRDPVVIYKANSIKLFSSRILTLNPFREINIGAAR